MTSKTIQDFRCNIAKTCGSCLYINSNYTNSLESKFNKAKTLIQSKIDCSHLSFISPKGSPKILHYRNSSKLAIRYSKISGTTEIGLFRPGSHDVIPIPDCPVHMEVINDFYKSFQEVLLQTSELTPYDETTHSGDLRYVAVRSSHITSELSVALVSTSAKTSECKKIIAELSKRFRISSAYLNINSEPGNQIFGTECVSLSHLPHLPSTLGLRDVFCDLELRVHPLSFLQANPWQAEHLYRRTEELVRGLIQPGARVWDLYSGVGIISLILARMNLNVLSIEENPIAVNDAKYNARNNHLAEKIEFSSSRVEDLLETLRDPVNHPKLIVVNPSRRGLAADVSNHLKKILSMDSRIRMIYISCAVETLVRDLLILTENGVSKAKQIEAFDMFPFTDKLEWIAVI